MPTLTGVTTNYFPTSSETYSSNLASTIAAGAATVPVNAANTYTDGDVVVLTVEPGTANQATFLGVKASSPDRFISCVWTEGNTGIGHTAGVTIADYDSATHYSVVTKGIRQSLNADGSLKSTAVQTALGIVNSANDGWNPAAQAWAYGSNLGNKEFTITLPGDLTGTYDIDMKVKIPRGTVPPTQCMSFAAASSQYAAKTSPTGHSFTAAFTVEAWLYVNSYTGANAMIASRLDGAGANGWYFSLSSTGQVNLTYNSAAASRTLVTSEMVNLRRWTHVAGLFSSTATATGAMYINGTAVNAVLGGAATALTQGGDLVLGSWTTHNQFYDGYMSEVRIWSVAQSQANIQANMAVSLVGSETNLVALFQGNGNFNDKTANANHLTASGGALSTQAANPYNATEYGTIVAKSFSAGTTTLTVFTGDNGNIPNQVFGTASYSLQEHPFGLPSGLGTNRVIADVHIGGSTNTTTSTTPVIVPGLTRTMTIPAGRKVKIHFQANGSHSLSGATYVMGICKTSAALANAISSAGTRSITGTVPQPFTAEAVDTPGVSGQYTYLGYFRAGDAGTVTIQPIETGNWGMAQMTIELVS